MKLAIQEQLVPGKNLQEKLANLEKYRVFRKSEVEGIELWGDDIIKREKQIVRLISKTSVKVSAINRGVKGSLLSCEKGERNRAITEVKNLLRVSASIGATGVIVVPIFGPPQIPDLSPVAASRELEEKLLVETLKEIGEVAEEVNSVFLLEPLNRYETHLINRLEQGVRICKEVDSPGIKVLADFFHMHIEERKIDQAIEEAGGFIGYVHIADSNRLLPGCGHFDFEKAFRALRRIGYNGYMTVEMALGDEIPGEPEQELLRCIEFLEGSISR